MMVGYNVPDIGHGICIIEIVSSFIWLAFAWRMKNNLTLLGTYVDRALSARTADRPDFQRMIADSAKGLFDVVLVWKLDRFSRDRYDSAHYKHVLKKNGVRVISIKENISDGPEGIILESMLEGYAEYYSAELAQKIRRGQHDNAMKCMNNGGNTPLGYYVDKATGRLEINPETAPYVQELFARYADGERLTVLQAEMEERGLRSKRGNAYSVSVLSNLLKNRKYIGEYKYGNVITPDGIPAIIDKELFERVQMRMAANKKAPARAKAEEEYLLTTKLYCGDCGRLMAGESGKGCKGIVYHYYKCSGAKRRLGCKKKAIKKHWIEETVVKLTVSKVLTDDAIDRIAEAILVMQEQGDTMTPVLKQQLQQCEAEIRNVMKAIRQGIITETTKECLEDLETQRDSLKASILQLQLVRRKFTKEEIVEWISKYKYGNINDLDYRKEIIDTFVNSVFVYDDKLVLTYNYKDGSETLTLQEIEAALSSNLTGMCPPKNQSRRVARLIFFVDAGREQGGAPQSAKNMPVACFLARGRVLYRPPYMKNPNLFPIGNAFGFFVFVKDIRYTALSLNSFVYFFRSPLGISFSPFCHFLSCPKTLYHIRGLAMTRIFLPYVKNRAGAIAPTRLAIFCFFLYPDD